jgi:hypothetical protein
LHQCVGDLPDYRPVALARLIAKAPRQPTSRTTQAREGAPGSTTLSRPASKTTAITTAGSEPSSTKSPRTGRKITLKLVTAMPPQRGSGAAARPRLGQNSRTTGRCR